LPAKHAKDAKQDTSERNGREPGMQGGTESP
jgi:hypothetical protein